MSSRPEGYYCTKEPLTKELLRKKAQEDGGLLCHLFFQYYPNREGSEEENYLNEKLWQLHQYSAKVRRKTSTMLQEIGFEPGELTGYLDIVYG
jgi:hypothetical protein